MKEIKAEILDNKKIQKDFFILSLKSDYLASKSKPGQFVHIKCSDQITPLLRRPFGIFDITKDGIKILYKIVGQGTEILSLARKKEILSVIGPIGNGFKKPDKSHKRLTIILIGGGHGVAPLYLLAKELKASNFMTSVLIGAKNKHHVVCENEFRQQLGPNVFISTDDGSKGYKGLVTDLLAAKIKSRNIEQAVAIYACGPKAMLRKIAEISEDLNSPAQISMEEYLGCGIGICLGCPVKTHAGRKLVCKDGPVFYSNEIVG